VKWKYGRRGRRECKETRDKSVIQMTDWNMRDPRVRIAGSSQIGIWNIREMGAWGSARLEHERSERRECGR
jgi:hypothetical protein